MSHSKGCFIDASTSHEDAEQLYGLRPEELTLMGDSWMTNRRLRFCKLPSAYQVWPGRFSLLGSLVHFAIAGGFFYAWCWCWHEFARKPLGGFGMFVVAGAACLGVLGPIVVNYLRVRYLRSISPLVEFNSKTGEVAIRAAQHIYQKNQVVSLVILSASSQSDTHTELHLLVEVDGNRQRHLVMTDYGSSDYTFKKPLVEFAQVARLMLLRAKPKGWKKSSGMQVEQLVAGR